MGGKSCISNRGFLVCAEWHHLHLSLPVRWQLLEAWKKLVLVGFFVLLQPGSILQVFSAFLFSATFSLLVGVAAPYKQASDDYLAKACGYSLTTLFVFLLILKFRVLTEEVDSVLTDRLRENYNFDTAFVTIGMIISVVGALALATVMAASQLVQAARRPLLKLEATRSNPDLPLRKGQKWHMFLSHSDRLLLEPDIAT